MIVAFDPGLDAAVDATSKSSCSSSGRTRAAASSTWPAPSTRCSWPGRRGATMDRLKPILQLLPVTLQGHPPGGSKPRHRSRLAARLLRRHAGHGVFEAGRKRAATRDRRRSWPTGRTSSARSSPTAASTAAFTTSTRWKTPSRAPRWSPASATQRSQAQGQDSLMPYIVLSNPADPDHRIVWLGWGEMWRLRQKNEAYLERFWTKLTRYAGGLNQGKVVKRITPNFGRVFTVGQPVVMAASIDDKGGVRLQRERQAEGGHHGAAAGPEDRTRTPEAEGAGREATTSRRRPLLRDQLQCAGRGRAAEGGGRPRKEKWNDVQAEQTRLVPGGSSRRWRATTRWS